MQTNKLNQTSRMRLFLILPFAMLLGSLIVGAFSYSKAKVHLTEDLNEAIIHLANAKSALLANPDTIKALRHMKETVNQPIIYKATDLEVSNTLLQEATFFQLALLEHSSNKGIKTNSQRVGSLSSKQGLADKGIVSDSIVIIPQGVGEGIAIELTGYTECNMASVFFASDQRLSLILFLLSLVTFSLMWFKTPKRPKEVGQHDLLFQTTTTVTNDLENPEVKEVTLNPNSNVANTTNTNQEYGLEAIDLRKYKLTPMQRRFMEMMLQANEYRVGKYDLCEALWDGKSNAEESLYTLIRRTKQALNGSGIEIICNRGESYELHVKH